MLTENASNGYMIIVPVIVKTKSKWVTQRFLLVSNTSVLIEWVHCLNYMAACMHVICE